jgi:hypothetical protein
LVGIGLGVWCLSAVLAGLSRSTNSFSVLVFARMLSGAPICLFYSIFFSFVQSTLKRSPLFSSFNIQYTTQIAQTYNSLNQVWVKHPFKWWLLPTSKITQESTRALGSVTITPPFPLVLAWDMVSVLRSPRKIEIEIYLYQLVFLSIYLSSCVSKHVIYLWL